MLTFRVFNLIVLDRGLHSPTVTTSPTWVSLKQGDMHRHVHVSLLKPVVLLNVMEIITPDDNSPVHLRDDSSKDTATNGSLSNELTLLVNIVAGFSLCWNLEPKAWVAEEPGL